MRHGIKKSRPWDERTREKIKVSQLLNTLQKCADGTMELTMTRLRAIEILLRKVLPDLVRAEVKSDVTHHYVAEIPPVLGQEEWERKYGGQTLQ